ncbi:MAG: SLBB domain-containing protein [Acidobacteria bacterium]|nr:SLBB domain-containing protein [Acidobacteriota bacterium]
MKTFTFALLAALAAGLAQPMRAQSAGDSQSDILKLLNQGSGSGAAPGSNSQGLPINLPPIRLPSVSGPSIRNAAPDQTGLSNEALQNLAAQQQAAGALPEPELEFQQLVWAAVGTRLAIFGHNLFESVPSTFAPLDNVQVTPDYLIGPGDELLIRAWGQIDVNYRATVDRAGEIYIPKVGAISMAGVKYADAHDYLVSQFGRVFKGFELSVTMGRLRSLQVFVVGQAKSPGSYTVSSLSSLVDALFAAGGPAARGSMRNIQLKRAAQTVGSFDLYDLLINGDKSHDLKLLAGDVIYIPPVGPLVALAGSVNTPAIFELKPGETLAEAVRYAGGLANTAAGQHVVVERIDNRQARVTDDFPLTIQGFARELHDGDVLRFLRISPRFEKTVTLRGNVAVPGLYPWRENMRIHDLIPNRESLITDEYWRRQNQLAVAAEMAGQRFDSAPREALDQAALKNDIARISTEINWDYAVIQRLDHADLSPHLISFNLGKAIDGDDSDNLAIQPNDVVTIFARTDIQVPIARQSKFVHLEGEVARPGIYQIEPDETLRQLLEHVGGLSPQAYLFGAEFTRESTRVAQQRRLDEYVGGVEQSMRQGASSLGAAAPGAPVNAGQAQAQTQAQIQAQTQAQTTLSRMRALRATGRIVLELRPDAQGIETLPDLALEDGDRLVVPFRPATVNVIGAVYNSNAFMYKPGKTVGDYLRLAGGPTRLGDKGREFVIRADGSTISRQQHNRFVSHDFQSLRLMPGDTIIVPQRLPRAASLALLRDYTSILSQFGIAAAGIGAIFP